MIITGAEHEEPESVGDMLSENIQLLSPLFISKAQLRSSSFWARMERILRQQRAQSFKEFRRLFIVTGLTVVFALLDIFVAVAF